MTDAADLVTGAVDSVAEEVRETRRDIHRHPELSTKEWRTATLAAERCESRGFTVRTDVGGNGVLADMDSGRPGPTVMLRADIDALPLHERGAQRPATSEIPGLGL